MHEIYQLSYYHTSMKIEKSRSDHKKGVYLRCEWLTKDEIEYLLSVTLPLILLIKWIYVPTCAPSRNNDQHAAKRNQRTRPVIKSSFTPSTTRSHINAVQT